jgi:ribonuclease P protein component
VQRLKTRPQFDAVMSGSTVSRTAHFALHRVAIQAPDKQELLSTGPLSSSRPQALFAVQGVWIGAMVPKRWAKRAVTRNAIKRQIYNVSAAFEPRLASAAHVVRLRSGFDREQFISATSTALKTAVRRELEQLFKGASVANPAEVDT